MKLPLCLTDTFITLVIIVFPFDVLPCRLRLQSCRDNVVNWKGREGGWGRRRKGAISSCKYSKKIDEVNTIRRGCYWIHYVIKASPLTVN